MTELIIRTSFYDSTFQSMKFSKMLIREAEKDLLHRVNKEECRVLVERWQSNECMTAIMNFFQQKSSAKL